MSNAAWERVLKRSAEREWELALDVDTVRLLAQKARAFSAAINDDYNDGKEHEVEFSEDSGDRHDHEGLAEEEEQDLTEEELRELVADLNVDEASELLAIVWIGRGDYEATEWAEAVTDARQRVNPQLASYLLRMPMLGDWLDEGLGAIGA